MEANSVGLELRAINIKSRITIFQSLEFVGVHLLHGHETQQIICPFHDDTKPSARAYGDSNKLFCFTCHKTWDVITVVMMSKQLSFPMAIEAIEKQFKLDSPLENLALTVKYNVEKKHKSTDSVMALHAHVEERLIASREQMELERYARFLTALDVITFNFRAKHVTEQVFRDTLRQILSKLPQDV